MTDTPETEGAPEEGAGAKPKKVSRQQVYTLVIEVGRKAGDGLPEGATGAAIMCFASGVDEAEAVRETVAILKEADLAPLDVTGYGTLAERENLGHEIDADERELMQRALSENSVIVVQMTPFYGDGPEDEAEMVPVSAPSPRRAAPHSEKARSDKAPKSGNKGPAKPSAKPPVPAAVKPLGKGPASRSGKPSGKPGPKSGGKSGSRPAGKSR